MPPPPFLGNLEYHVRLCLEGIPLHAWNESIAKSAVARSYDLDYVELQSLRKEDTRALNLWAWTEDPSYIPKVTWLTITGRSVQFHDGATPPSDRSGLLFRLIVHLDLVEDPQDRDGRRSTRGYRWSLGRRARSSPRHHRADRVGSPDRGSCCLSDARHDGPDDKHPPPASPAAACVASPGEQVGEPAAVTVGCRPALSSSVAVAVQRFRPGYVYHRCSKSAPDSAMLTEAPPAHPPMGVLTSPPSTPEPLPSAELPGATAFVEAITTPVAQPLLQPQNNQQRPPRKTARNGLKLRARALS
ncbi:hypothetical protein U9M48_041129 [Paspalum notatum var. saurae]|uniref:Uncharacterized protein n=1 Tax=Paspalum notatum var. saurae TaxID=547442 RepID=A0AAQ3XEH4_PASNO